MGTLHAYENHDILNTFEERGLTVMTRNVVRFVVRNNAPVVDMVRTASAPSSPAKASGSFFFRDDGAGKMQFCVLFPSGTTQILATEP